MGSKNLDNSAVKRARNEINDAYRKYRREAKKQRLLRKQMDIKVELETMGIVQRHIPVVFVDNGSQKIKVKRGVA